MHLRTALVSSTVFTALAKYHCVCYQAPGDLRRQVDLVLEHHKWHVQLPSRVGCNCWESTGMHGLATRALSAHLFATSLLTGNLFGILA